VLTLFFNELKLNYIQAEINKFKMKSSNGSNNNNLSFCLEVWSTDYNKIKDTCILAEKLGYDGFYYGESLADIDLDCWTIISNLSAITNKIKLGPVITYLLPQYRNIFLLAKQAMYCIRSYCNSAASISAGLNTLPICPRYFRLYSRSKLGEDFAFSISSLV